jgi:5'-3' exonuclease
MLDTSSNALHIVEGNSFLIDAFRRNPSGLVVRQLLETINKLATPPVFIFDGRGGNERRRSIFAGYKSKRVAPGEDIFSSVRLFRECLAYTASVSIECPGWEADDVVASIARRHAKLGQAVRVVTIDRDLYQLAAEPRITVTAKYEHVPPHLVRLYKTFTGDPSDNIPGIPSFGEKSWEKLDKLRALNAMRANDFSRETIFSLNMKETQAQWVIDNADQVRVFWEIVGLYDVPYHDIAGHLHVGSPEPKLLDAKLKEYLL